MNKTKSIQLNTNKHNPEGIAPARLVSCSTPSGILLGDIR